MHLEKLFLLPWMSLDRFNSIRALTILTRFLPVQTISLYSSQAICPCFFPSFFLLKKRTFFWVCPGPPCLEKQTSWHFCINSSLLAYIIPESGKCDPWIFTSFLWPYSIKKIPEEAKSAVLKSRVASFPCALLAPSKNLNSTVSWSLHSGYPWSSHPPCWCSITPLLAGSSITWRRNLSSRQS